MDLVREFGRRALVNLGIALFVAAAILAVYASSIGWSSRSGPPPTITMQVRDR
jgi:hypothetical protein